MLNINYLEFLLFEILIIEILFRKYNLNHVQTLVLSIVLDPLILRIEYTGMLEHVEEDLLDLPITIVDDRSYIALKLGLYC